MQRESERAREKERQLLAHEKWSREQMVDNCCIKKYCKELMLIILHWAHAKYVFGAF